MAYLLNGVTLPQSDYDVEKEKYKTALVTGGKGFIGSRIVKKLRKKGYNVTIWDKKTGQDLVKDKLRGDFDVIFHLAALISVPKSIRQVKDYLDLNVLATEELMTNTTSRRFVFVSSCAAKYSENIYGLSKRAAELVVQYNKYGNHNNNVCLRLHNIFGENQKGGAVVEITRKLLQNKKPLLFSVGTQTRDYVYVEDCADRIIQIAESDIGGIREVGYGKETSTLDLYKEIKKALKSKLEPELVDSKREGDIDNAKSDLPFKGKIGFKKGLDNTVKWIKNNYLKTKKRKR